MSQPIINRCFATASAWTFTIPPIKVLLDGFVGDGKGWADPFAGKSTIAEYGNDQNPELNQPSQLDALAFAQQLPMGLKGVLFDPPYSYRQITEHYKSVGKKATPLDTSYNFYRRVMDELTPKIRVGGLAISFGWNSNGFGKKAGFRLVEVLLVAHGLHHNDTICVVEEKV